MTPSFSITTSRGFTKWLAALGGSLAFTTYQAGKLFFLGVKPDGNLSVFERSFPRAMGLAVTADARRLYLATQVQLYRFDKLDNSDKMSDYDATFAPHQTWITGDIDIHDVGISADHQIIFANTLFNCLATTADGHSFRPVWRPRFISQLVPEDRCHLNGVAMQDGVARFVTCVSRSDVTDGWRDRRVGGGVIIDVATDEVVAQGLSMPHSPRLYRGRLWVLNSGEGSFGYIDIATGLFTAITFCAGYARGLSFAGDYAIIGLSRPRGNRTFSGLPLDEALKSHDAEARCGLMVVDLNTGATVDWIRIEGVVDELFDVAFLPSVRCPSAIGLKGPEISRVLSVAD